MNRVWTAAAFALGAGVGGGLVVVSHQIDRYFARRVDNAVPALLVGNEPMASQVLADQADAWNRGDLDGFMAGYVNSPELTFRSGGTVTKGYDETLARYRKRYQTPGAEMGKLTFDELVVKRFGRTTIVTGRWTLDRTADTPTGLFTLRMELTADGWKIVDDHTSAVEPTPQKPEKK